MKIAFISRWFLSEHARFGASGGPEMQRVKEYQALGHEVVVLSQDAEVISLETRLLEGIRVAASPRWKRRAGWAWLDKILKIMTGHRKVVSDALDLHQFLKNEGPFDLLEAQCEEPDGLVVAFLNCFRCLPPWCVQVFALRYDFRHDQLRFKRRWSLGFVFKKAKLIKVAAPMIQEILVGVYGADSKKICIAPHNLDERFGYLAQSVGMAPPKIETERALVVCLAALNSKKGVDQFVEASALLARRRKGWRFLAVGGSTSQDDYESDLKARSRDLGLSSRLEWVGQLKPREVAECLKSAAVVVTPSRFDEFNRACVEAVVLGVPVVVTKTCGAVDWIKRHGCGIGVESGDVESLANAIERVVMNPGYRNAAQIAGPTFAEEFSATSVAKESMRLMRERLITRSS